MSNTKCIPRLVGIKQSLLLIHASSLEYFEGREVNLMAWSRVFVAMASVVSGGLSPLLSRLDPRAFGGALGSRATSNFHLKTTSIQPYFYSQPGSTGARCGLSIQHSA